MRQYLLKIWQQTVPVPTRVTQLFECVEFELRRPIDYHKVELDERHNISIELILVARRFTRDDPPRPFPRGMSLG